MPSKPPESLRLDRLATPIGEALIVTDEAGYLRAFDWADCESSMARLLRLHYGSVVPRPGAAPKHVMHLLRGYFAGELGSSRRHRVAHGRHAVPAHRVDRSHCDRSRRNPQLWRAGGEAWVCQIRAGGGRGKRRQPDQRGRAVSSRDRRRWLAHRLWRRHRAQAMATRSRERGFPWQAGSCGGQFSRRSVMCFGSGFSSPFSTRLTMSVSTTLVGVGMPISSPFLRHKAVEELDLGAAALHHVLAHRRPMFAAAAADLGQPVVVDFLVAAASPSPARAMISGSMCWISSSS